MKPTKSQQQFLDSIYSAIAGSLQRYDDMIQVLNHIELRLTKDGRPRKVFEDNFGLPGLPTKVDSKYASLKHYVLVSAEEKADGVLFSVRYRNIDKYEAELSGVPEQVGNWITFKVDRMPTSPADALNMIRTYGIKSLQEKYGMARKDLRIAKSEKFVQTVLNIGNSVRQFRKFCKDYETTPGLYPYKYMITDPDVLDLITQ